MLPVVKGKLVVYRVGQQELRNKIKITILEAIAGKASLYNYYSIYNPCYISCRAFFAYTT